MKHFPVHIQHDAMDCGAACIKIIAEYYGRKYSLTDIKELCIPTREGVTLANISETLENIGFRCVGGRLSTDKLVQSAPLPCIIHWEQKHFVVLYKIKKGTFYISDPAVGLVNYNKEEFESKWLSTNTNNEDKGIVLLIHKQDKLKEEFPGSSNKKNSLKILIPYFLKYKKYFFQLLLGLVVGSCIQLIFPFLTQSLVDIGIGNRDINFIWLILLAQLTLLLSRSVVDFIRNWILLHISTRINLSMLSDFLIKLTRLPMSFFDNKMVGDILQRIGDHDRVEKFITVQSLDVFYSFMNIIIFGIVLFIYDKLIFAVFITGSMFYILWLLFFVKKRKILDYLYFGKQSDITSKTYQFIEGMTEAKLQNCTQRKRWEWEDSQAELFEINVSRLKLQQKQQTGSILINETKNILITFMAAYAVINGNMTLGMMLAAQYILGQLNYPVEQIAGFIYSVQDAKISLERIGDVRNREDENSEDKKNFIPDKSENIYIKNLSFSYEGTKNNVLKNINLTIKKGKVTAIVGSSGSGKTTLIKLLLKFYDLKEGQIIVGESNLNTIHSTAWRKLCGAVMQDGYIFSESVARNIAVSEDNIDKEKLLNAAKTANITNFIKELPLGYDTIVGGEGRGLSQGQKQRLLIARAVYKDPKYIFLDEATNALDATNELIITENLSKFYQDRTVVIVAHRLSTVRNADNIVVMDNGEIIEQGTHDELVKEKGAYYNLIKNQLELGE